MNSAWPLLNLLSRERLFSGSVFDSSPDRPLPGAGLRLTVNAMGHSYSAAPQGRTFNHPFRPFLSESRMRFTLGIVDTFIPLIGTVPMVDPATQVQAALALDSGTAKDGLSWVMLEVTPNADGVLDVKSKIELIHTGDPTPSKVATLGRQPIALLTWPQGARQPSQAIAIVRFHLRYERVLPPSGGGLPKHFFL